MAISDKRYFFIQMRENFFESEDILEIEDIAPEQYKEIYVLLYIKLILKSLATDGILRKHTGPYTAKSLRILLQYKKNGVEEDIKFIEKFIIDLSKIDLIRILKNQSLFLPRVRDMVLSKTENADRMKEMRKAREIEEALINATINSGDIEFLSFFEESFNNLKLKGYFKEAERNNALVVFQKLFENYSIPEITLHLKEFLKRDKDYSSIAERDQYLLSVLKGMILNSRTQAKRQQEKEEEEKKELEEYIETHRYSDKELSDFIKAIYDQENITEYTIEEFLEIQMPKQREFELDRLKNNFKKEKAKKPKMIDKEEEKDFEKEDIEEELLRDLKDSSSFLKAWEKISNL